MTPFWAMATSIAAICCLILVQVWVPGARPGAQVLECDALGGYWSSTDQMCHKPNSPLAGLAS